MTQVRTDIGEGTVMPAAYMKHAVKLFKAQYPTMTHKQIATKWKYEVQHGRERAVVTVDDLPLPTPAENVTTATVTQGRAWSDAESAILTDILTGSVCV